MSTVNENSELYYGHTYWNDIPVVLRYIQRTCSGRETQSWVDDFKKNFAEKPFKHGLFILCGNGWVEREFIDKGIVQTASAFDYSQDLLDQAEADKQDRRIQYFQADVNKIKLPKNTFDLVVNVAGFHHVQYLYRFHSQLYQAMTENGVMVSFDYVGPSRNQYSDQHWSLVKQINQQLPAEAQANLSYPDLKTMLHTDPTEAINSSLIFHIHQQFFSILKRKDIGGGLAYLLLTHNIKFFQLPTSRARKYATHILKQDHLYTTTNQVPNLFSYWVSKRKSEAHPSQLQIQAQMWAEKIRESLRDLYTSIRFSSQPQHSQQQAILIAKTKLSKKLLLAFFLLVFSTTLFFASGVIESIDEWLYISVTRNLYYHHNFNAAPKEFDELKNVYFNSQPRKDGTWYSTSSSGYSVAMLPAVILSDLYREATNLPISQHFPLETEWSLHLFGSFTHVFWGAVLATIVLLFVKKLDIPTSQSIIVAGSVFFLSNLFPLSNHSYPHIFQTCIYMAIMTSLLAHSRSKSIRWLVLAGVLAVGILPFAYNTSFLLLLPGIVMYFLLKNDLLNFKPESIKRMVFLFVFLTLLASLFTYFLHLVPIFEEVITAFKPIIMFEGMWGLLFSAGKSVFLYNPLLILLVIFWWKIPKKYQAELIVFLLTSVLLLIFYGQAHMIDKTTIVPIWAGGNNWGLRYLTPIVPFGMILALLTAPHLSKLHRTLVFYPLIAVAVFVQMIGVSLPYDLQYGSLPYTVNILDGYHDRYNFASHIPRFSPLINQTKFFFKRLIELPATITHHPFNTRLYDGFSPPAYLEVGVVRSYGEGGGYLQFDFPAQKSVTISANLIGIFNEQYSTPSANILMNNHLVIKNAELQHNQVQTMHFDLTVNKGRNEIAFLLECDDNCGTQTALLQELVIDDQPVNLGSIDLPYVDHGTETWPTRKYYGRKTNYWALWSLRHNIFVTSFDFWWLRYLYYWDLPKEFILTLLAGNSVIFYMSGRYVYRKMKNQE